MVIPLIVLAVLSVIGGYLGFPGHSWLEGWLEPIVGGGAAEEHGAIQYIMMLLSVLIGLVGIGLGYYLYVVKPEIPKKIHSSFGAIYKVLFNKYYVDELYEAILVNPIHQLAKACWKYIDVIIVDGSVLALGRIARFAGEVTRQAQTGALQVYAVFIVSGLIITVGYLFYGSH